MAKEQDKKTQEKCDSCKQQGETHWFGGFGGFVDEGNYCDYCYNMHQLAAQDAWDEIKHEY